MHLGLSPYYRGTATNFWPLVNAEPECIGATLHIATLKVDGGPILHQVRPIATATDTAHDLGCKTIQEGAKGMLEVLKRLETGKIPGVQQGFEKSLLYKRKDFSAEAVKKMWGNFESGMMKEYVEHLGERLSAKPIVELTQ